MIAERLAESLLVTALTKRFAKTSGCCRSSAGCATEIEETTQNVMVDSARKSALALQQSMSRNHPMHTISISPHHKPIDLAPMLMETILWSARNEVTDAPPTVIKEMTSDRDGFVAKLRADLQAAQSS